MSNDARLKAAIEAAAKALHDTARDRRMMRWETASEEWRDQLRTFVAPLVSAALAAADDVTARAQAV
ncbi:hypothetical protein GCM10019059_35000 [Camelimonas fluminis]|uniref:Uncharacterized protein n=1 Tax=Camelimonas fluminis TaxID=1576911 RepID=A0ABV7UGU6_9HYPH|nr:hypothetical protein [Camelimonas fluminis]GHE72331.1 hypothetical protein GCM10019059_35000 [Camelimonas fluminis]